MKNRKRDTRVIEVLAKMAGNENTLIEALDEARSFSPEEMRALVSLLTPDRQPAAEKKRRARAAAAG